MDLGHREPHGDRILLGWAVSILLLVHGANIFLVEFKSEEISLSTRRHSPDGDQEIFSSRILSPGEWNRR